MTPATVKPERASHRSWPLCTLLAAALGLAAGCAGHASSRVEVSGAWARPTTPGAAAAAAYLVLQSAAGDELIGVSVAPSVARFAQVHETLRDAATGELRMRHAARIALPAGERVEFAPGRRHVMLLELAQPLAAGDTFALALTFARARPETVRVPVRDE